MRGGFKKRKGPQVVDQVAGHNRERGVLLERSFPLRRLLISTSAAKHPSAPRQTCVAASRFSSIFGNEREGGIHALHSVVSCCCSMPPYAW